MNRSRLLAGTAALGLAAVAYDRYLGRVRAINRELRTLAYNAVMVHVDGRWHLSEQPPGSPRLWLPLQETSPLALRAARRQALHALSGQLLPRHQVGDERAEFLLTADLGWCWYWPCEHCGGGMLPLGLDRTVDADYAHAAAILACEQPDSCPRCAARLIRDGLVTPDGLWYDTDCHSWQLALELDGETISLPLESPFYTPVPQLAQRVARLVGGLAA